MKEHVSCGAIRRMLDRPGLRTTEIEGSHSMRFLVTDLEGREVIEIGISRSAGEIECAVIERGRRRGVDTRTFRHQDSDQGRLQKIDRQIIENCSTTIRSLAARYESRVEIGTDARQELTERIRELLEARPEDAAEKIAEAVSIFGDLDTMTNIAGYLGNELFPGATS